MTPAEALEAAELAEAKTAYRNQLAREMYERGQQTGYSAGRRAAEADEAASWRELHRDLHLGAPSHAELEERRWGPGGREHFADPRPGDFPGRGAQPQPDREAEAG